MERFKSLRGSAQSINEARDGGGGRFANRVIPPSGPPRPHAGKKFDHYHKEATKALKDIQAALKKHYDANKNNPDWGHVGDIADHHKTLTQMRDRLTKQGEYAPERPGRVPFTKG